MDWRALLTFTGWIGVHPEDRSPVAHLIGLAQDGPGPDEAEPIVAQAEKWDMADSLTADRTPVIAPVVVVAGDDVVLDDDGTAIPLIAGPNAEWLDAGRRGWVLLHLSTRACPEPTLERLAAHLESATPGTLWSGICTTRYMDDTAEAGEDETAVDTTAGNVTAAEEPGDDEGGE